jgi:5-methylcytosine-specific restriction endonuclease McrA
VKARKAIKRSTKPIKRSPIKKLGKRGKENAAMLAELKREYLSKFSRCQYCHAILEEGHIWELHHKLKRSLGGKHVPENLVAVHRVCHNRIHQIHYAVVRDCQANLLNGWTCDLFG